VLHHNSGNFVTAPRIPTTLSCLLPGMKKDNEFPKHWPSSDILFSSASRQNWAYKEFRLDETGAAGRKCLQKFSD